MLTLKHTLILIFAFAVSRTSIRLLRQLPKMSGDETSFDRFIDEIIMTMQTGVSFCAAADEVSTQFHSWRKLFLLSDQEGRDGMTYGQSGFEQDLVRIFFHCRKNESQSYRMLVHVRQILRLRLRLSRKKNAISLQARAQALICASLFAVLLLAQWFLNPEFSAFASGTRGKLSLSASFLLLTIGEVMVFHLARAEEWDI